MSRIGLKPIEIPQGVTVKIENGLVSVEGPKGKMIQAINSKINAVIKDNKIEVARVNEEGKTKAMHGTMRQIIFNMIKGVTDGWTKGLEIQGTGFHASLNGNDLVFALGFSHPVNFPAPDGITFITVENKITVSGIDKSLVGQVAANIRAIKPPDVYKGKGIRYEGEQIKLKPGKQAKVGVVAGGVKK
ncbi:50S ribosomal protein L6 [Candidatus Shapirobacteria bacterium CG08_land_8_20_14_0_20_39_18]|uniref:Large ribosomal subunit protein uL6 n=1 Tax=Candidatus Shapirobacteria bacterium CG08_land_8_20_14_0_20_39_18 TaxID=1974883 RepID=A0A2M6XEE1_9BACT|nr:MAG: 50S ribosomal protein L6 [Candidatus Shapirobacteria bacterium CG08_land_8_20_14_0_20_39_18]PIY66417.1 MAG: 50S ribosomal protein L6 [Candidatus Shapirobacteria bacterium CG_4_10_14_0_8_um_filter_39_15]PJE68389.1 MAG: 50S ribosomal protein L6 [Candidatus Shapirobacteria bacterium CG10_big_fil_rev_8_21_14_0_10_38_8]